MTTKVSADMQDVTSGGIVQVVNSIVTANSTGTTTAPFDDTIMQITEGVEFLSLDITPTSASNKLLIDVHLQLVCTISMAAITMGLFNTDFHATNSMASGEIQELTSGLRHRCSLQHYMTAPSASATTFTVRAGTSSASTLRINGSTGAREMGGVASTSITIMEIQA